MKKFVTLIAIVMACLFAVQAANYTSYSITLIQVSQVCNLLTVSSL